jgi:uncharacterized repeat protein (TIGR01451 family)
MKHHLSLTLLVIASLCLAPLNAQGQAPSQDPPPTPEITAPIDGVPPVPAEVEAVRYPSAERSNLPALRTEIAATGSLAVIVVLNLPELTATTLTDDTDAGRSQRALIAQTQQTVLDRLGDTGASDVITYDHLPLLAVRVDEAGLAALEADPLVAVIGEDLTVTPALGGSVPMVRADLAAELGYRGDGQAIAILDTGVDRNHPDLSGRVVSEACYSTTDPLERKTRICPNGNSSQTGTGAAAPPANTIDGFDHGTHVAAIAAAVAPDADIIAVQVFSRVDDGTAPGNANRPCQSAGRRSPCALTRYSDILQGLNRVLALRTSFSIAAVNMSLGSGSYPFNCDTVPAQTSLKLTIDILRANGIPTVIASGNSGYRNAIGAPACISSAISVGSVTGPNGSNVASSSNVSSVMTLFAPGEPIRAAVPSTTTTCGNGNPPDTNTRCVKGGTSMAAPHVAGALAVLRSANPGATVTQLVNALTTGTVPRVDDERSGGTVTKPRLEVYQSLCVFITCDLNDFRYLEPGFSLSGFIQDGDTADTYFYDNYVAGSRLSLSATRTVGNLDPALAVYNPSGQLIMLNNDGGGGVNARIDVLSLATTGRYKIVVYRSGAGTAGVYSLATAFPPLGPNPPAFAILLDPVQITAGSPDIWVRIQGSNFKSTSTVRLNGALRQMWFSNSERVWIKILASDLTAAGQKTITVHNPAPGGGSSIALTLYVTSAINGEARLLAPASLETTTGITSTFAISWTHPTASWRNMQNLDFKVIGEDLNTALWLRFSEASPTSTVSLLTAAGEPVGSVDMVGGVYGPPVDLVITDTVAVHMGQSIFTGSGQTLIFTPTVTFGPAAVGAWDLRFAVDDDAEFSQIQNADVLGRYTIRPEPCPQALGPISISGATTGATHTPITLEAVVSGGADASTTFTWFPAPSSGQGTAQATFIWPEAERHPVSVLVENCAGFEAGIHEVAIAETAGPRLRLSAQATPVARPGDPVTLRLRVTNAGATTATGIVVRAPLPPGAVYVSGGALSGGVVEWQIPMLDGYGATAEVSVDMLATTRLIHTGFSAQADGGVVAPSSPSVVTEIAAALIDLQPINPASLSGPGLSLEIPAGATSLERTLAYWLQTAPALPLPEHARFAGRAWRLAGFAPDSESAQMPLGEMAQLTIDYAAGDIQGLNPELLTVHYLNEGGWQTAGVSCQPNPTLQQVVCQIANPPLTDYALAETQRLIFLPQLGR